jgi:hypothetical protein
VRVFVPGKGIIRKHELFVHANAGTIAAVVGTIGAPH